MIEDNLAEGFLNENQENGIQKGGEEGNENVTESLQSEGEQGEEQIIFENKGELRVTPTEEPGVVQEPIVEEEPVSEEVPVVVPVPEKILDWAAIDAAKEKAQALRKR